VITAFWPDHVELHGSLEAYRAAKETIVRHQRPGDSVVVDGDDPGSRAFADLTPAERHSFSTRHSVARGAYLDGPDVVLAQGGVELRGARPTGFAFEGERAANVVAACAAAVAAGTPAAAVVTGLADPPEPVLRARRLTTRSGLGVIDDGMAATPGKTRATLASLPARSAVVICGGETGTAGGPVHSSAAEIELVRAACRELARVARSVVAFGGATDRLCEYLEEAGIGPLRAADLEDAVAQATCDPAGADTVVFSPMFPLSAADRARFARLVDRATTRSGVQNP
jgi:UDP-N-acetylmuramoylalanine--D-glutamate ligase